METNLLPGETELRAGTIMTSREWASAVLADIAEAGLAGSYPQDISAFDVGRALSRVLANKRGATNDMESILKDMELGWRHVNAARIRGGREG